MVLSSYVDFKKKTDSKGIFLDHHKDYESSTFSICSDPHERLSTFHLAIIEQLELDDAIRAYEIYVDLISKKDEFCFEEYAFSEEIRDVVNDIVLSLQNKGFQADHLDFLPEHLI